MLDTVFVYPSLGPLLGTTFDKAVGIMVGRWKLLCIVAGIGIALGTLSLEAGSLLFQVFTLYWEYAAIANAVRLFDPAYRMRAERVVTISGISIGVGLATVLGLFCFIAPGVWLGNKYSLSAIIAAAEDRNLRQATGRSWALTTGAFWPTLWFNLALQLGYFGVIVFGELAQDALGAGVKKIFGSEGHAPTHLENAILIVAIAVYTMVLAYGIQALNVAQRFWLRALVERETATALEAPQPA